MYSESGNVIISAINTIKKIKYPVIGKGRSSIKAEAAKNICFFPLIISENISMFTMIELQKSLEREYASYLKLVISNQVLDIEDYDLSTEAILNSLRLTTATEYKRLYENTEMRNLLSPEKENFNLKSLDGRYVFNEDENLNREKFEYQKGFDEKKYKYQLNSDNFKRTYTTEKAKYEFKNLDFQGQKGKEEVKKIKRDIEALDSFNKKTNSSKLLKYSNEDIKKATEAEPTILDLEISVKSPTQIFTNHILIGLKVIPHVIPTEEMIYYTGTSMKERSLFFKTIQFFTGEKKFWKDLIFEVKEMKKTVTNWKKFKTAKLWFSLKNMERLSLFRNALYGKGIMPNCTFVYSIEEIEYIKNGYGVDLLGDNISIKQFMKTFFAMGLIIIDEPTDTIHVWDDVNEQYFTVGLSYLTKMNRDSARQLNSILELVSKK
jgi:hypothetical protein